MIADMYAAAGTTFQWWASTVGNALFGTLGNGATRVSGEFSIRYLGPALASE